MSCINLPTVLPGSPSKTRGQIQVILRPMSSGKSTKLMRQVQCFQIAQYKCLVIKYVKDTRYSNNFSTHDRNTMETAPVCLLRDIVQEALGVAIIGIDKGQFFPDIVEFSETMANAEKTVIVAGLDGTFQRKAFGTILNLVPLVESVMECFHEAAYTKRLGTEKEVEVIGGADKCHAMCPLCYFLKASGQPGQPAALDSKEDKENCPALGKAKPAEAAGARKPVGPHQVLQCNPAN